MAKVLVCVGTAWGGWNCGRNPLHRGLLVQDMMVGLSRSGRKIGCGLTLWLGVALRCSLGVDHSDSDSEGLRGKEEELSENCDYN